MLDVEEVELHVGRAVGRREHKLITDLFTIDSCYYYETQPIISQ